MTSCLASRLLRIALFGLSSALCAAAPSVVASLDSGWKFFRGDPAGAEAADFDAASWRSVDLPHDWSMEDLPAGEGIVGAHDRSAPDGSDVGYLRGGVGWYRRVLADSERPEGSGLELRIEGAQQECDVWVNGTHVAFQPHGYIPFSVEIGRLLRPRPQANAIAVRVCNPERNSRWASGSGLYRGVSLRGHDAVSIAPWGAQLDTLWLDGTRAGVQATVELRNDSATPQDASVGLELTAPDGTVTRHPLGDIRIAPAASERMNATLWLKNVQTWTPDTPRLYRARFRVRQGDRLVDESTARVGLRTIQVSADRGFLLNGHSLKLRGGCVHHDNGLLGARAFADAERRRVRLLKESGFNAVRTAHNPPSTAFLDACDELGLVVIDEFTDCWEIPKKRNGYQRYFDGHAERDLQAMLARDFNHPSVVMWSIGNEIPDRFSPAGVEIAHRLAAVVRRVDPRRPITAAINGIWEDPSLAGHWAANDPAFLSLDVGGYNYMWEQYENDHVRHPQRVMCGTESYPNEAWENWAAVERHPYVIGDFVWSAIDYLGESGIAHTSYVDASVALPKRQDASHQPWPVWNSWCGDLDVIGDKKPQSFYRDVVWRRSAIELLVHEPIPAGKKEKVGSWGWPAELPSWSWAGHEGEPLTVSAYTRAARVRLTLNDRVVGEQPVDQEKGIAARFVVPWAAGTLTATALNGETVVGTKTLQTTEPAAQIRLEPEGQSHPADRGALVFIPISLVDANGARVATSDVTLNAIIEGEAELCAFGSADPADVNPLADATTRTFRGRALLILRSTGKPGRVHVEITAPSLSKGTADLAFGTPVRS